MNDAIPEGARLVARVLLLGPGCRVLLLHAEHAADGSRFWVTPGGGLKRGESFEQAAGRELLEETGLDVPIGRWIWTRRHAYSWNGRLRDQYERFFVANTDREQLRPASADNYVIGHRWWDVQDIAASAENFTPRRLAVLAGAIAQGEYPNQPIDCGA
jgi:8-oxo-dGTP pyrophosphatase MutT (NUDIX family)